MPTGASVMPPAPFRCSCSTCRARRLRDSRGVSSRMSDNTVISVAHQVVRWSIDTGASFDDFRARFETAVPVLDTDRMTQFRAEKADWETVLEAAEENAP